MQRRVRFDDVVSRDSSEPKVAYRAETDVCGLGDQKLALARNDTLILNIN